MEHFIWWDLHPDGTPRRRAFARHIVTTYDWYWQHGTRAQWESFRERCAVAGYFVMGV